MNGQNFGLSEASALGSGIPIISPPVYDIDGTLGVYSQNLIEPSFQVSLLPRRARATSNWTVQNIRADDLDLIGDVYLLFATSDPYEVIVNGDVITVDYATSNVGLSINKRAINGDEWVIVETYDAVLDQTFYYPGISLDSLVAGEVSDAFSVNYRIKNERIDSIEELRFALPQYRLLMAYLPIPEPGTGVLVGLGMLVLAGTRRTRS